VPLSQDNSRNHFKNREADYLRRVRLDIRYRFSFFSVPDRAGANQELEFYLYKNGGPAPYLEPLRLWLNVRPPG
jgi:hypothetical protein